MGTIFHPTLGHYLWDTVTVVSSLSFWRHLSWSKDFFMTPKFSLSLEFCAFAPPGPSIMNSVSVVPEHVYDVSVPPALQTQRVYQRFHLPRERAIAKPKQHDGQYVFTQSTVDSDHQLCLITHRLLLLVRCDRRFHLIHAAPPQNLWRREHAWCMDTSSALSTEVRMTIS